MDNPNYTIEHRKGQHLTDEERGIIQTHLRDGWSKYRIAKDLRRPYNTVKNEIERGTVTLYNGKIKRYKAETGAAAYRNHRKNCIKPYKRLETAAFIRYVEDNFFGEKHWSLDSCVGRALKCRAFRRDEIVCTKTLYNYIDNGLLRIKNMDLPEKLRRSTKSKAVRENKRNLGKSIEERPKSVESRSEFGHWEFDSVLGCKGVNEPVVLTMVERMTRAAIWIKVKDHSAGAVTEAVQKMKSQFREHFSEIFKTITADNGSEFSELSKQVADCAEVYFTHPFSSWEKGTNECHNRLLRRFISKGKSIADYNEDDIAFMADWSNGLPRKILGYRTPEEMFEEQLDCIYSASISTSLGALTY